MAQCPYTDLDFPANRLRVGRDGVANCVALLNS